MFMGHQNFLGLQGINFVGSKCYFANKYTSNACIYVRGDVDSWARVNHESHEH